MNRWIEEYVCIWIIYVRLEGNLAWIWLRNLIFWVRKAGFKQENWPLKGNMELSFLFCFVDLTRYNSSQIEYSNISLIFSFTSSMYYITFYYNYFKTCSKCSVSVGIVVDVLLSLLYYFSGVTEILFLATVVVVTIKISWNFPLFWDSHPVKDSTCGLDGVARKI